MPYSGNYSHEEMEEPETFFGCKLDKIKDPVTLRLFQQMITREKMMEYRV